MLQGDERLLVVRQQFHGAFEVGKEHRDLLALAFQSRARR
jgi:hypothetical protein